MRFVAHIGGGIPFATGPPQARGPAPHASRCRPLYFSEGRVISVVTHPIPFNSGFCLINHFVTHLGSPTKRHLRTMGGRRVSRHYRAVSASHTWRSCTQKRRQIFCRLRQRLLFHTVQNPERWRYLWQGARFLQYFHLPNGSVAAQETRVQTGYSQSPQFSH